MTYLIANITKKEYLTPEQFGERDDVLDQVAAKEGLLAGLDYLTRDVFKGPPDEFQGRWVGDKVAILGEEARRADYSFDRDVYQTTLFYQFLERGRDISRPVVESLVKELGPSSSLARLKYHHRLPYRTQRMLSENAMDRMSTEAGLSQPFETIDDLFDVFGVRPAFTSFSAKRQLRMGVEKMSMHYPESKPFVVHDVELIRSSRGLSSTRLPGSPGGEVDGSKALRYTGEDIDAMSIKNKNGVGLSFTFGPKGTSTREAYAKLLAVSRFHREDQEWSYDEIRRNTSWILKGIAKKSKMRRKN